MLGSMLAQAAGGVDSKMGMEEMNKLIVEVLLLGEARNLSIMETFFHGLAVPFLIDVILKMSLDPNWLIRSELGS